MFGQEITQLASLLKQAKRTGDDSDSDEDEQVTIVKWLELRCQLEFLFKPKKNASANMTPANFVSQAQKTTNSVNEATSKTTIKSLLT